MEHRLLWIRDLETFFKVEKTLKMSAYKTIVPKSQYDHG